MDYDESLESLAMIRPTSDDINAIVDTARAWPADARARLIERLEETDRDRTAEATQFARGPTAAEVIARFGDPGPGPSDETVAIWIRKHKEAQGGE
jgi:hypothetical protein